MIDRRTFLRRLGFGTVAAAAAATGVFDVEKLLWVPGEKTILLPELAPVELYGFVSADWMTAEALRILTNQLQITRLFSREYTENADTLHRVEVGEIPPHMNRDAVSRQVIQPAMVAMAQRLDVAGVRQTARLPHPKGVESSHECAADGLSIRMIKQFDIVEGRVRMAFDVAGKS